LREAFPQELGEELGEVFPQESGEELGEAFPEELGEELGEAFPQGLGEESGGASPRRGCQSRAIENSELRTENLQTPDGKTRLIRTLIMRILVLGYEETE